MGRRRKDASTPGPRPGHQPKKLPEPHIIYPTAVYRREAVRVALGLPHRALAREVQAGRLRVLKRSQRYFFLGEHLLEWLRAGEITRLGPGAPGQS